MGSHVSQTEWRGRNSVIVSRPVRGHTGANDATAFFDEVHLERSDRGRGQIVCFFSALRPSTAAWRGCWITRRTKHSSLTYVPLTA